ncbi:MAG TPA: cation:proton antiporter, partial [Chthonomonadales bacterium]|nr:cation:proton antiporter [Chthonomonadales bacterium]
TTVVAYGSYLAAAALHVSGVIAVVTAGLLIGNCAMVGGMSAGSRLAVSAFWEYAAFVVNSMVFLLIGIEVCHVQWAGRIWLPATAALIVLAGRSAIYPLSWIANLAGGRIPRSWQHLLFWGGLRGALSMALALSLSRAFPMRGSIIAATFGVVLASLLVQGLSVGPLARLLQCTGEPASCPDR